LLKDLTERVLGQEGTEPLETGRAAVANQLINTRLRAIEQERKIKETEDLEARIEALEQAREREKGARSLEGRIRNLEAGGGECPACGFDGDWSNRDIAVEWWNGEEEYLGPEETVFCEHCGEPTIIVVTWKDLDY
jgi:hypothetical protein